MAFCFDFNKRHIKRDDRHKLYAKQHSSSLAHKGGTGVRAEEATCILCVRT